MEGRPVTLTIAGSDSGGGAGIQADLKTMEAFGAFGTSAITSVTAQNTVGVKGLENLSPEMVGKQIDAVADDFDVKAAKTGMLSNAEIIETVAEKVDEYDFSLVVDPVMVAESGDRLLEEEAEAIMKDELIPRATLVTPNAAEAEVLTGYDVEDERSMERAAKVLVQDGADSALVKGGHIEGNEIVDVLYQNNAHKFYKEYVDTENLHGTGCTISSAITAELAKDKSLRKAVSSAEDFMYRAIRYSHNLGEGHGPVHHMAAIRNEAAEFSTLEKVRGVVKDFVEEDVSRLVPEVGMNFALATPYAVSAREVGAVEGRITKVMGGVKPNSGAWLGASSHVARFLLSIREQDESIMACCNLRFDDRIEESADDLFDLEEFDRDNEPDKVKRKEGSTMGWAANRVMADREDAPDGVIDRGEVGKEAILKLLGEDHQEVRDMVLELNEDLTS